MTDNDVTESGATASPDAIPAADSLPQDATDGTEPPAEGGDTEEPVSGAQEAAEAPETGNREAAKYRRQLRETEAERDQLRELVAGFQRAEIERFATQRQDGPRMYSGDDLWRHVDIADLVADDGSLDPAAVNEALESLWQSKRHLFVTMAPELSQGRSGAAPESAPSWQAAARNARSGRVVPGSAT